jgi:DNA-binding response OmpR family regulator
MRVLLIEDDRMIGAAVQQALKDAAYAVDWVTDGEAAVHAAESETYELVLLDLGLPALLARPGTIRSRSELERQIHGWNEEVESNTIEFLIHSVRRKLGPAVIRNVRGVGWMVERPS